MKRTLLSLAIGGLIWYYVSKKYSKKNPVENKKRKALPEHLIREQLARNYAFLGEEGVDKVRKSFVIVVGLGGVGSHAAHMLIRSGVQRLRLIDFDQVTLSSLNRHAVATHADVGTAKAICLANHFENICPQATVEPIVDLFTLEGADQLLDGQPDYVLDCIDNIDTKIELIKYCVDRKINIISSMGSGAKADPSRICIADISYTQEDALARSVRKRLRKLGIDYGVPVVYSVEKPGEIGLLPLEDEKSDQAEDFALLPNFRSRILPGTLPALFGNSMATHVITDLAGFKTEPLANKKRDATYNRMHRDLSNREQLIEGESHVMPLKVGDIGYIFEEIWQGRSALSGELERLTLVRWDNSKRAEFGNVVCMTKAEAKKHVHLTPRDYPSNIQAKIQKRFDLEKKWNRMRLDYEQFFK